MNSPMSQLVNEAGIQPHTCLTASNYATAGTLEARGLKKRGSPPWVHTGVPGDVQKDA